MKHWLLIPVQLVALFLISEAGYSLSDALHLPLPGSLLGMLLLLVLLATGLVPLRWIEASAALLVRHLAFFFIPIAVGLVAFGDLFVEHGLAIVVTLVTSAAVGILVAGVSVQTLGTRRGRRAS